MGGKASNTSINFHSQEEEPVPRLCVVDEAQENCAGDVDGILICAVNVYV